MRAARRQAVLDAIERRLADPALRPALVAAEVGISTRYLHMLLAEVGSAFERHVLERRLTRCHEQVVSPAFRGRTLTDIAFAWGPTTSLERDGLDAVSRSSTANDEPANQIRKWPATRSRRRGRWWSLLRFGDPPAVADAAASPEEEASLAWIRTGRSLDALAGSEPVIVRGEPLDTGGKVPAGTTLSSLRTATAPDIPGCAA